MLYVYYSLLAVLWPQWTQSEQHLIYYNLSRILKEGLEGKLIQTQELPLIFRMVCQNFAGYLFAWDFIQVNWDRLIEK